MTSPLPSDRATGPVPSDVVVGRAMRRLSRALWLLCAATAALAMASTVVLTVAGASLGAANLAVLAPWWAAALVAVAGAGTCLVGLSAARDAVGARRALDVTAGRLRVLSWVAVGLVLATAAVCAGVLRPVSLVVPGTLVGAVVGLQLVPALRWLATRLAAQI